MRKIKLLILLGLASLQLSFFVAAQGPRPPERRRGETVGSAPEREGGEKRSSSRDERPAGRPEAREKAGAWDRREQRVEAERPAGGGPTERDRLSAGRSPAEKAARWERRPEVASRAAQEAKLREHVFRGWINGRGRPVGFHYEGGGAKPPDGVTIIRDPNEKPDANGVYRAKLKVGDYVKENHTFFPKEWSPAQIEKAKSEAYDARASVPGRAPNYFQGRSSSGVRIGMYTNKEGVVVTYYPIKEK